LTIINCGQMLSAGKNPVFGRAHSKGEDTHDTQFP
jgi:hypothetical protein